jgi:predicted transcriptional regulator
MAYIYRIVNDINEKTYIGKTVHSLKERWAEHISESNRDRAKDRPLYRAIRKYGIEHFHIELVEECSDTIVNEREIYWIERYGTFKNGYNATIGGDGKHYIDYDMVEYNYSIYQNITQVANLMGISTDAVSYILKQRHIPIKTSQDISKERYGKSVICIDKSTKEVIKTFDSIAEAARWLIDNNLTGCKFTTIRTHISEVMRGKRKSAAGFIWK